MSYETYVLTKNWDFFVKTKEYKFQAGDYRITVNQHNQVTSVMYKRSNKQSILKHRQLNSEHRAFLTLCGLTYSQVGIDARQGYFTDRSNHNDGYYSIDGTQVKYRPLQGINPHRVIVDDIY